MKTRRALFCALLMLLAAFLTGQPTVVAQGPPGSIPSVSMFTVQTLREGGTAYGNRVYVWRGVPAALRKAGSIRRPTADRRRRWRAGRRSPRSRFAIPTRT